MSLRIVPESQHLDRKSLRKVTGSTSDFAELAQDCVCFANGAGGTVLIGIEDDADVPPARQRVDPTLLDRIRKSAEAVALAIAPGDEPGLSDLTACLAGKATA